MLDNVIVRTVGFAIAHEAAHIRLGHLEKSGTPLRIGPDMPDQPKKHGLTDDRRNMANAMFAWSDEMDADAKALRIMLRLPSERRCRHAAQAEGALLPAAFVQMQEIVKTNSPGASHGD